MSKQLFDEWPERYDRWFETPVGKAVLQHESELILDLLRPDRESGSSTPEAARGSLPGNSSPGGRRLSASTSRLRCSCMRRGRPPFDKLRVTQVLRLRGTGAPCWKP